MPEFCFLGTGTSQGVPVIHCKCAVCQSVDVRDQRLRASLLVTYKHLRLSVDIGPDFRQQMLRYNSGGLDGILITHEHMDHIAGLDDVRAYNFTQQKPIPIYCSAQVADRLREQFSYIFSAKDYPGIPQIDLKIIDDKAFEIEGVEVVPVQCYHAGLPVFGFRFGDFTYITDANEIPPAEFDKITGSKVLVLNALRKKEHHSHFNLEQAIAIGRKAKAEQLYLTHISHQMGLYETISQQLPQGVALAYDGLRIVL